MWQMGLQGTFPKDMCFAHSSSCTESDNSTPLNSKICRWREPAPSSGAQRKAPEQWLAKRRSPWQRHSTTGVYSGGTRESSMCANCLKRILRRAAARGVHVGQIRVLYYLSAQGVWPARPNRTYISLSSNPLDWQLPVLRRGGRTRSNDCTIEVPG